MREINELISKNKLIWDQCLETKFLRSLIKASISENEFKKYMIEDSIYLREYARVFGMAIYKSQSLKEIKFFYSLLSFVENDEGTTRLKYLAKYGLNDEDLTLYKPLEPNKKYTTFMLDIAKNHELVFILAAVLPCMLSYLYIFKKVLGKIDENKCKYLDFIIEYSNPEYEKICAFWLDFFMEKCEKLKEEELQKIEEIFTKSSLFELEFFSMICE